MPKPRKQHWVPFSRLRFSKNKYTQLLLVLLLLFLVTPLSGEGGIGALIFSLGLLVSITILIRTFCCLNRGIFRAFLVIAGLGFSLESMMRLGFIAQARVFLSISSNLIYSLFFTLAIVFLGRRIALDRKVTIDTIIGGVCIYVILGLLWFLLYQAIYTLDPNAFSFSVQRRDIHHLAYFSFTTLTTLGYGDIIPLSRLAMFLAGLEAVLGQMYSVIFIARLVGLYVNQEQT